jgi:hypothetical protein
MIDHLGGWLQHNLIVFVAIVLLPLKWVVVRICRDREAESLALMSVPEDLSYVALGLVMGDMINSSGAFRKYFAGSQHVSIDILITVAINLGVALIVHSVAQWSAKHFRSWRAAENASVITEHPDQGSLAIPNEADNVMTIKLRHLFLFASGYGFQLLATFAWLHWVAKVVANT